MENLLLATDTYKVAHMVQYPKGTTKVYSYLQARTGKKIPYTVFYGLQYYLKLLTQKITTENADEFLLYWRNILGSEPPQYVKDKIYGLVKLGYIPLQIKAVREGTIVPVQNVLMTLTNTHPDFYWVVGFFESLLLKVWNTCTVASYSKSLQLLCKEFAEATCDNEGHLPFQVHDFGYRGCSSDETAALSGSAHLVNFLGTDTIKAIKLIKETYRASEPIGLSVPATEHSVMCAFGQDHEFEAFENMLDLYPSGIVSIVSDTYNLWDVLTKFAPRLKDKILAREGKVVFRPDSGDPEMVICGNPNVERTLPARYGALKLLDQVFGHTVNSKGYKVLNQKVGLIYGDGMYFERFQRILTTMKDMGYASSNLVIGVGGILLQQHNRDDQGYAIKATFAEVNGEKRELMKDPVTDSKKKSHKGLLSLNFAEDGSFVTRDQRTELEEKGGLLQTVFLDGKLVDPVSFDEIRQRAK